MSRFYGSLCMSVLLRPRPYIRIILQNHDRSCRYAVNSPHTGIMSSVPSQSFYFRLTSPCTYKITSVYQFTKLTVHIHNSIIRSLTAKNPLVSPILRPYTVFFHGL